MRRPLVVALVTILVVGGLGWAGWTAYRFVYERITPEECHVQAGGLGSVRLSPAMARNASVIVAASVERGLPEQAAVIALATAYQESGLRNLDYGDRDSLGLFQQRPSYGWGTPEQIMDPWYTSHRFYEELVKFPDWQTTDVNDIAQKVQRSGHPEAYRKHEENSRAVAAALRGTAPASLGCVNFETDRSPEDDGLARVVEAFGDAVEVHVADGQYRYEVTDEATAWAIAHHVVANSYDAAVTSVKVADKEWTPRFREWSAADSPAPESTVVATVS